MPIISLLQTTAQPENWLNCAQEWLAKADHPESIEHVLTFKSDTFPEPPVSPFPNSCVQATTGGPARGWDEAAQKSTGEILATIADDAFPPEHWDTQIVEAIGDTSKEAALWIRFTDEKGSSLWAHLLMAQIVTRPYYERYRYLLHKAYFARYADMEFTDQALRDGIVIDARDKIVWRTTNQQLPGVHHPTTDRINRLDAQDADTYQKRKAAGFPPEWPAWKEDFGPFHAKERSFSKALKCVHLGTILPYNMTSMDGRPPDPRAINLRLNVNVGKVTWACKSKKVMEALLQRLNIANKTEYIQSLPYVEVDLDHCKVCSLYEEKS